MEKFDVATAYLAQFPITGMMGILLYWMPLALCALGYLMHTHRRYRECIAAREADKHFDSDTIGTLIGRFLMTVLPVFNLFAAVFNVGPEVFGRFFAIIGRVFDRPLVAKRGK